MWRTGFRQCVGSIASAIHVPSGAVNAATMPIINPTLACTMRRRTLATVVVTAFGNMANNEVPRAIRSEASNRIDNDGTRMAPPPTPSRPARMPAITPNTTINRPVTRFNSIEESREGTNMSWLRMTNAMNTTNAQRSTTSDNRDSSSEPIWPPTNIPMNTSNAAIQSTLPLTA